MTVKGIPEKGEFYIRVELGGFLSSCWSEETRKDFCEEAVEQIKRHVDRVAYVTVEQDDTGYVICSGCGGSFSLDPDTNTSECCGEEVEQ